MHSARRKISKAQRWRFAKDLQLGNNSNKTSAYKSECDQHRIAEWQQGRTCPERQSCRETAKSKAHRQHGCHISCGALGSLLASEALVVLWRESEGRGPVIVSAREGDTAQQHRQLVCRAVP